MKEFRVNSDAMRERTASVQSRATEARKQAKAVIEESERILRKCG